MIEHVICLVDSDREFVSEVQFDRPYNFTLKLYSKATSDKLLIFVDEDVGYYEIYPCFNVDVTSSDVGGITTCTIIISECRGKTYGRLEHTVIKDGEVTPSTEYLTIEESQPSTLGNEMTVSFNRPNMSNDHVNLTLHFDLDVFPQDSISQNNLRPKYEWHYLLSKDVHFAG